VRQEKTRVDDVEWFRRLPLGDVSCRELDVRKAFLLGLPPRDVELDLVEVDAHRSTARSRGARKLEGHVAATAADVEAEGAGRDANLGKESTGGWRHDLGEDA
jgi:hypothetical protein